MAETGLISLGATDLLIAAALVAVAGAVSLLLGLRLERRLGLAALRTVVQLLLIGHVLRWVFALDEAWAVLGIMIVMIGAAGRAAIQRPSRTFTGIFAESFLTLLLTGLVTTLTVTHFVIGVQPWHEARYVIPLLGMVLGNTLTGISLSLDHLLEALDRDRSTVEMELAHGASRWEAAQPPVREAVRKGMIPIINSMMVVGIVSLPGMMTGQILAGADPLEAVKYQIVVMFMIAAGSAMGSIVIALFVYRSLFDKQHRLRHERIRTR